MNDWLLLDEFTRDRSETAFRALVERHAGLVHSSALRQTRDVQLAKDVAQAVFTLLARKAGSLRRGTILSGWLFQTTRFVAARAVRAEQRRRQREHEAFAMQHFQTDSDDDTWNQLAPVIDEAIGQLGARDRDALLLRFVDGRSLREVGTAMGVNEEAAKKRVTRAIERLRQVLGRSGVAVTAATLETSFGSHAAIAVSTALVHSFAATALAPVGGGVVSGLVIETLAAWWWAKARLVTGAGLVAVFTAVALLPSQPGPMPPKERDPLSIESVARDGVASISEETPASPAIDSRRRLRLRVVSVESGNAITGAVVYVARWIPTIEAKVGALHGFTDRDGICEVGYSSDVGRLDVGAFAPGWAARYATWPSDGDSRIPAEYTLRLGSVTNVIGGQILDIRGQPVSGAEIWFMGLAATDYAQRERPRERFGFVDSVLIARTGSAGRWSWASVPAVHPGFQIEARHPDYATTIFINSGPRRELDDDMEEPLRRLWAGELISTIHVSRTLTGVVTDENRVPIADARVQAREQSPVFATDDQGRFSVPKLPEGPWTFTVSAEGYAPVRTNTSITADGIGQPIVITLRTGAVLRLRLVDENGFEVPDAEVGLEQWGEYRSALAWRGLTDFNGRLEWRSAPPDVEIELFARKEGYCFSRDLKLRALGHEPTFELHHSLVLQGTVIDAQTGQPVRDFKAVPGYGSPDRFHDQGLRWYTGETVRGANGQFELVFKEQVRPWHLRIIAEGYHEWISPPLTNRIRAAIGIKLEPADPEESVRGVVLQPDGAPAAGAEVALLTFEHNVRLRRRAFEGTKPWVMKTDAGGTFRFPATQLAHSVAAVADSGYAHQRLAASDEAVTLRLEPWGRVVGQVDQGPAAMGLSSIELYDPTADNYQGRVSLLGVYSVKPDTDRSFAFDFVPPGQFTVFVNSRNGIPYHHGTPVTVQPGETVEVTIAERLGARVTGKFRAPVGHAPDWSRRRFQIYADLPSANAAIRRGPKEELLRRELDFWTSPAGREHVNTPRVYSVMVNDDGGWASIEPFPPGSYELRAAFPGARSVTRRFTINDEQAALDLGETQLEPR